MAKSLGTFIFLFVIAGLLQAAFYLWTKIPLGATYLWQSYTLQGLLGGLSLWILFWSAQRFKNHVAFVFMGISFLKFALYFFLFHPILKADGILSLTEKTDVLIPYLLALGLETFLGVQRLNKI